METTIGRRIRSPRRIKRRRSPKVKATTNPSKVPAVLLPS